MNKIEIKNNSILFFESNWNNIFKGLYIKLINDNILTQDELDIMNRARNHKGTRHPKNTDIITYKYATAFEAIIGYLYLKQDKNRLDEIINYIVKE